MPRKEKPYFHGCDENVRALCLWLHAGGKKAEGCSMEAVHSRSRSYRKRHVPDAVGAMLKLKQPRALLGVNWRGRFFPRV
jgi:hypothetical protein